MVSINIHAAKTLLSRRVDGAAAGAEIMIAKAGRPVARLTPLTAMERRPDRTLGALARRPILPVDFDAPLPDFVVHPFEVR